MSYEIEFKPRAIKDIENLQHRERERAAVERLSDNLAGDVKRLTSFTPEYRLRVSDYRVLFEVEGNKVVIYRVRHRRDAYR